MGNAEAWPPLGFPIDVQEVEAFLERRVGRVLARRDPLAPQRELDIEALGEDVDVPGG